jgi:hypothetical protein
MWSFQLISQGNTTRTPPIADCLGVCEKPAATPIQVNHFALNYNASTGALIGRIILIEKLTVSPGGTVLSGTFDEPVYTMGNKTGHLTGQVAAQRITVDTIIP